MKEISENDKIEYFKPEINFLPTNLDFDECLKDQRLVGFQSFNKDYCAKIISTITEVPVYNKRLRYENTGVERPFYSLSSKIMYAQNKNYKAYIDLLIKMGVIETDNQYVPGEKSKAYRLTQIYSNQPCKSYLNYKFGKTSSKSSPITVEGSTDYNSTTKSLIEFLPNIKLDYKSSVDRLKEDYTNNALSSEKFNYIYCSLEKLNNGDFFAKQDEYGRLHTNLTNLKKEYRNYLTANGEELVSLDLKNSQPFFSTILTKSAFWENKSTNEKLTFKSLNKNIKDRVQNIDSIIMFTKLAEDNEDLIRYRDLVLNGGFYEYFLLALKEKGIQCLDRTKAKTSIFEIFFGKTSGLNKSKNARVFKLLFPTIYKLFALIKISGHNLLALILQCIESRIIIDGVAGHFIQEYPNTPIYTIHDSIVVPLKNLYKVKIEMINYTLKKTGYRPSIEEEIFESKEKIPLRDDT